MNQSVVEVFGKDKFNSIPEISLPNGKIDLIHLDLMKEKIVRGMDNQDRSFFAFKQDGVEYIDCLYRESMTEWKVKNKVRSKSLGRKMEIKEWMEWQSKPSLVSEKKIKIKHIKRLLGK